MEEWRPVVGWEGIYEVSCLGRIRRIVSGHSTYSGRILNVSSYAHGYPFIRLRYMGRTTKVPLHKLVAEAFLGPRPPKHEVNHKDGDKANAKANNLEYVTGSENNLHAYRFLSRKPSPSYGATNGSSKLTAIQVAEIRASYDAGNTQTVIAKQYGVSQRTISLIVRRETWTQSQTSW